MNTATSTAASSLATTEAPLPATPSPPPFVEEHPAWRMPLSVYERIVKAGLLEDYRDVYLWKGRLCDRMGINRPHIFGVNRIFRFLIGLCGDDYSPETEAPVAFRFDDSAPQPDVKVLRGRDRDHLDRMPTTADVALVVEVTDSTLPKDRALIITYAIEEIPVYWLLNIAARRMEVYAAPVAGVYTSVAFFDAGQDVPVIFDGRDVGSIPVADLLP